MVMEKSEFLGEERYFIQLMAIYGSIAIIGLGITIWILAERLIRPISDLTENAIALSQGNLNTFIKVKRKDELGILGRSFNLMTEQLRSQIMYLEDRVKERTASLNEAHQKTQLALQKATEADRAKENFLLKIGHELKTPLNAIIGYSQQILQSNSQDTKINVINQSGLHLLTMLDDIFQFNKLKNDAIDLKFKPFDLHLLCKSVVAIVSLESNRKKLPVKLSLVNDVPRFIKADEKRLRQVLINLLSNAVKFTDRGGVILRVTAIESGVNTEDNNCVLQFEVIDSGIGISSENLPKIFAPFFQAEESQGTGLGLNISQQIVSAMGGEIKVQSQLSKGSNFHFKIIVEKIVIPDSPKSLSNIKGYIGKTRKIILVEDILENRLLIKSILVPLGFEIIEASNGKEGLELLKEHCESIDLVLTDLLMPTKSGLTMILQIQAMSQCQNIPIVGISASVSKKMEKSCLNHGCDAFLNKPIDRFELLSTIEKLLNLKWIREERYYQYISPKLIFQKRRIANEKRTA